MNREPYRGAQSAANRGVARPAQAQRDEPQPVKEAPAPAHRPVTHTKKDKKPRGKMAALIIGLLIVAALALGGWLALSKMQGGGTGIDSSKYQAVFFTNGQVYFGKLTTLNDDYLKLTDVFYLQTQNSTTDAKTDSKNPQDSSTDSADVQLIKLGNEVHGPEDAMTISREQVLFYENLKSDGKVAQTIAQYKQQ